MDRKETLMDASKEQLVNLFLKSEIIRKKQEKRIIALEKELAEYEDIALERAISGIKEN